MGGSHSVQNYSDKICEVACDGFHFQKNVEIPVEKSTHDKQDEMKGEVHYCDNIKNKNILN